MQAEYLWDPESVTEDEELPLLRTEKLLLNMGPQHPATHGVLQVILELEGEKIIKATPHLGYLHRGTEKIAEAGSYQQVIPLTDRLDYICAMSNNWAYVRAVEKLLQVEVPERAEWLRTLMNELARLSGHLFWLGTQALDIGAMTVFFWTFREREIILDAFERICGARLTNSYMRVGGVENDIDERSVRELRELLAIFPQRIHEYDVLLKENRIWVARTRDIAIITAEDAINYGLSGPSLRGSGVNHDLRKSEPFGVYDQLDFEVPLGSRGDTYDRYYIRVREMEQSASMVTQILDRLPEIDGPIMTEDPKLKRPDKVLVNISMEAMIQHFKVVAHGFDVPKGEVYCGTETPKGELGFYLVSDGSGNPYKCKIRAPSFVHMGALDHMSRGYMIADIVTVFGSFDVVMGECDR
ncbi:MAG: NADH dehydrogenase (quinone) subunit D [Nitrospirota bacterium]|nr:NADH dehydrogenase (quinone) subunit D [Nitrospirota bacterium]